MTKTPTPETNDMWQASIVTSWAPWYNRRGVRLSDTQMLDSLSGRDDEVLYGDEPGTGISFRLMVTVEDAVACGRTASLPKILAICPA